MTSAREQRLWIWTVAVVVAIYSTLGLSGALAPALGRFESLGVGFFLLGMFLVTATVVSQGLRVRPGGVELAVALGIVTAYFLVFARMASPIERSHVIEYGVLAVFIHEALTERVSQGRRVPRPALNAVLATSLIGAIDECVQLFLPGRVFDPVDIFFNVMAAAMAVTASAALRWARRRVEKRRRIRNTTREEKRG